MAPTVKVALELTAIARKFVGCDVGILVAGLKALPDRVRKGVPVPALHRVRIDDELTVEQVGDLAHLLAHIYIGDAEVAHHAIHFAHERLDDLLAKKFAFVGAELQILHHDEHVDDEHIETPRERVWYAASHVEDRIARLRHNRIVYFFSCLPAG